MVTMILELLLISPTSILGVETGIASTIKNFFKLITLSLYLFSVVYLIVEVINLWCKTHVSVTYVAGLKCGDEVGSSFLLYLRGALPCYIYSLGHVTCVHIFLIILYFHMITVCMFR